MARFVVVYHRLPFEEVVVKGEKVLREPKSPNGIIPTLKGFFRHFDDGLWLAWNKVPEEKLGTLSERRRVASSPSMQVQCVGLTDPLINSFYHRTSKAALWPILHSFTERFDYDAANWDEFRQVNRLFAEASCQVADTGATIWIHDYNLWLVPGYIRSQRPDVKIAFFHHTPFPASDMFGILPWRKEILESLLACDRIGFHAPRYAENFASCARSFIKPAVSRARTIAAPRLQQRDTILQESVYTSALSMMERTVYLDVAPIGVDDKAIAKVAAASTTMRQSGMIRQSLGVEKVILSIGRIDYTKGTREMLQAYEQLLETRQDLLGHVKLCVTSVAPASGIRAYDDVREEIERRVGAINGRFSTASWTPILFFTSPIRFQDLIAWYLAADICWITPLRDGLNLVAKEYVAAKNGQPGVLVLSEFTGAAIELDEALRTHPYSARSMLDAISRAVAMPEHDARSQMQALGQRVKTANLASWTNEMIDALRSR
ncbi:MAG: glucosylglycerol-phosphate synthase [Burkholderiaceae bacterium]